MDETEKFPTITVRSRLPSRWIGNISSPTGMRLDRRARTPSISPLDQALHDEFIDSLEVDRDDLTAFQALRIAAEPATVGNAAEMVFALPSRANGRVSLGISHDWGIKAIGADQASLEAGSLIKVGILDSGIANTLPVFDGVEFKTENFTDHPEGDNLGHGTSCAAILLGRDVGGRRVGVARGVRQALVAKVVDDSGFATTGSLANGIRWALALGARIISISVEIDFTRYRERLVEKRGYHPLQATSVALKHYIENVRLFDTISRGATLDGAQVGGTMIFAAAGNGSDRPHYKIATAHPAAGESVISVGAIDETKKVAPFSNEGVDFVGPGVGIGTYLKTGAWASEWGTSMATPFAAGAAVLWMERLKAEGLTPTVARIIQRMRSSAITLQETPSDMGAGLVQVPQAFSD